jgi:hypothetical protein
MDGPGQRVFNGDHGRIDLTAHERPKNLFESLKGNNLGAISQKLACCFLRKRSQFTLDTCPWPFHISVRT